ncbi:MFS transporter [Pseudoxanthomonas sacheonensis]|uniref:MFS family permease n=1 Tax=Pseudoxanthomonas sacheonensis TaxID=443615 RepID=A0ABU1RV47_9GAMM|nr:MFS transporter [Pseudoxanthomonas sacheonensis]MDR6842653.1 MFS family permease [Pseudoxanthomonas sacheonensis]
MNPQRLFVASCIALLATAMSFAIRGDIMGELELAFGLDKIQLGWISGAAFWGFGLSILFGGTLCDLLGMGRLLKLAAVGHIAGVLLTVFATDFTMLFAATVLIGIANGFVEAGINPLIATLYRDNKTARLVKLHAWFPGGIVVGGVLAFAFTQLGLNWQSKMLLMLLPSAIYATMFFAQRFPETERKAAGVSTAAMYGELKRPLFLVVFVCMWLTAATELGPGQWVSNIFNEVMHSTLQAGVLLLVWINGIMYALRQFGGGLAHRFSPVTLIAVTAPIAALGLWLFGRADTPVLAFAAAALLAVGTAFWWPTMLGLTSERFPRGGALALAAVGAAGAFSTAVAGPVMGWINNTYGAAHVLPMWAVLPIAIALIFGIVHWVDRARGGYRIERVDA